MFNNVADTRPPRTTWARGNSSSLPTGDPNIKGTRPSAAVAAVISTGTKRS